jgi:lipopolysaccharide biosynthesis glycosyltransferase
MRDNKTLENCRPESELNLLDSNKNLDSCPLSIVCGADNNFAIGLAITLYSALVNLNFDNITNIYIIDGGISDSNKNRLKQTLYKTHYSVNLFWIKPDINQLTGIRVSEQWALPAYFRLLAPRLLPVGLKRVIYLDCDLVINGNLAELWKEELGNSPAFAVQDFLFPYISNVFQENYQELNLKPEHPFCNSGVLLMNLELWRSDDIADKALEYSRKYHVFDQDSINAVVASKWKLLDKRWNVQIFGVKYSALNLQHESIDLIQSAFILHFTTQVKPWHPFYRQPGADRFAYYLRRSKWFTKLEYIKWFISTRILQIFTYALARQMRILKSVST